MNIIFATTEFVTEIVGGGQAIYLSNIARVFSQNGHKVFIVTISDKDGEIEWYDNIKVIRVKYLEDTWLNKKMDIPVVCKFFKLIWNVLGKSYVINKRIRKLIALYNIDIIQYSNLGALPFFIVKEVPTVIRLSDFCIGWRQAEKEHFVRDYSRKQWTIGEWVRFSAIGRSDYIFAPSNIVANETSKIIDKHIDVIETPYISRGDESDEKIYNAYLSDTKYLLFFGSLNYIKGIHIAVDCANTVLKNNPELKMVFLGLNSVIPCDGCMVTSHEYIRRKSSSVNNQIVILPPISEWKYIRPIIEYSIGCLMPSRIDNIPNCCIEAMALKKVVVGTRGASFEQLITDGYNGLLCDIDDVESCIEAINKLISMTDEQRIMLGARAYDRIKSNGIEKVYTEMMQLYRKATNTNC